MTRDGSGNLWVSIVGVGVYQRLGERWVPFGGRDALPREPAVVLTTDEAGRTWLGYTGNRVAMVEGDSVRLFTADDGLSVGIVLAIHVRGSHVWVGGDRGLASLANGRAHSVIGKTVPGSGGSRASWKPPAVSCGCTALPGSPAFPPTRLAEPPEIPLTR